MTFVTEVTTFTVSGYRRFQVNISMNIVLQALNPIFFLGGRWHCGSCASCVSCESKVPWGDGPKDESLDWIFETKIDSVVGLISRSLSNKYFMSHIIHAFTAIIYKKIT